jgi:hypothetical protein
MEPSCVRNWKFSTLCDRERDCERGGLGEPGGLGRRELSAVGEVCGTCLSGRNALRMLAYVFAVSVSSELP